jgi:hypothetical protein
MEGPYVQMSLTFTSFDSLSNAATLLMKSRSEHTPITLLALSVTAKHPILNAVKRVTASFTLAFSLILKSIL